MELNVNMFVHSSLFTHMWLEQFIGKLLKENEKWKKNYKQICYGLMA